jgi:nucleoside-diphosphate-sugar epimerase
MKILIIGGSGLISTWITSQFVEQGHHDLTLYNRGQTEVRYAGAVKTIHGDRRDYPAFERQMAKAGPFDCVIDMVCYAPEEAQSLVRAFKGRTEHLIFCSTVDVYAKPATRYPYVETEQRKPLNTYGKNKAIIEDLLMEAHNAKAFAVTTIRPAYTYGESRGLIHSLGGSLTYLDRIRRGKPIIVHGDGQSMWVCCHANDVARAFVAAMGNPKAYGKTYHTTGEEWFTWNRYHQTVAEALNAPAPTLVHIPTDLLSKMTPERATVVLDNFQFNNIFDNSAAHHDLQFEYTIPFLKGIQRITKWLDERHKIPNSDDDPLDDRIIAAWEQAGLRAVQVVANNATVH